MRRIAFVALIATAACGGAANPDPGPLDRLYFPTGLAFHDGRLLVASSNADLRFDDETGGSLIALEPTDAFDAATVPPGGAMNVRSFAGDLAIADPVACATSAPLAVFATRGSNTLNTVRISPGGALECQRCGIPLSGLFNDPLPVAVACGGGRARAFVGYLRGLDGQAWLTEYDFAAPVGSELRHRMIGSGPARALAYDADHDRLWVAGVASGTPTPLRWIDLGGCTFGAPAGAGGCTVGQATFPTLPAGLELRSIALSDTPSPTAAPGEDARRAYLTGRLYDIAAAELAGGRTTDAGGVFLVVDLVESPLGGVDVRLVRSFDGLGRGAQDVRVVHRPAGGPDIVVALATDDGILWIYDDGSRALKAFPRNDVDGRPLLGDAPYGIAVDPVPVGADARVYVGSFGESAVTRVDIPLADVDAASIPTTATGAPRRITGAGSATP